MLVKFISLVISVLVFLEAKVDIVQAQDDDVVVLTDDSFEDFITNNQFVLVEFYAPWCGHCKNLAPEYAKAATELLKSDPVVYLAKVDATENSKLSQRFEVSGYPTMKFFRSGSPEEYDGGRDAAGIVEFCKSRSDPNYKPPPESVVSLTSKDEFDEFTKSGDLTLVEFYAPWCGHCKQLAPVYEKAAKELLEHDPPIKLAKVDATKNEDLAKLYDVSGYPTLFMFRAKASKDGELKVKSFPYNGPRDQKGIVDYMTKQSGDAAKLIKNIKELKSNMLVDDIIVVGMFSSEDVSAYETYQHSVSNVRDKYTLFYTTSEEIRNRYKVSDKEAVVVILPELMVTKYDEPYYILELKDESENLKILGFIDEHETPLIGTRNSATKSRYNKLPLCVMFVSVNWDHGYRQMTASWRNKLLPIAHRYRKDFHFAMSDDEENQEDMKAFGFDDSGGEFSLGCYGVHSEKYPMSEIDEWDEDEVEEFIMSVKNGKAKAYLRSQIPPKKQSRPVLTVTGKTFHDIVLDPTKDVVVELYAPWCGHCKKFEPEFKKLAKTLSSDKNLVFSKMDATANDAPDGFDVHGYPTIYFARGADVKPVKYEGNRDIDDIKKFLKENAVLSFQTSKDEL